MLYIMRYPDISGDIQTEQAAVIQSQCGDDNRIRVHLPHIGNKEIFLVYNAAADGNPLIPVTIFLQESFSV